jgi:hypothetical protein
VLAGTTTGGVAFARYNEDGSFDTAFGSGGKAVVANWSNDLAGLTLQADGSILALGTSLVSFNVLLRLTQSGVLDLTLGAPGTAISSYLPTSVLAQEGGRILVASTLGSSSIPYGKSNVRRAKACIFSGCESRPATVVPAGSSRSDDGGNEIVEAFDVTSRFWRLSE